MTRSGWSTIAAALAVFGMGLVTGRLTAPANADETSVAESSSGERGRTSWGRQRIVRSAGAEASVREREDAGDYDDIIISQSLLAELSESFQKRTFKHGLFDRDDLVAKCLGVTTSEKAQIETLWQGVKEEIKSLEASRCVATIPGDGPVKISVPDLSGEMTRISKNLVTKLDAVLGNERAAVFSGAKQLERILKTSQGEQTYEISFEPIPNERWRYRISSDGDSGKRTWVAEDVIPDEIRHLTDASGLAPNPNEE